MKNLIKQQEDLILTHNNNIYVRIFVQQCPCFYVNKSLFLSQDLTNTKDAIIKAKQEAFKVQNEELHIKEKLIEDQQSIINSLKNKIENLEETFEINKVDLENRLNNKEEDLKHKIDIFETNLHYGRKYFEEILDEKEQMISEKTNEINNLNLKLTKKYEDDLQTHHKSLNQFIESLKIELNEKNIEIDQIKQHHQNEIQQLVVANQLNSYADEYYRLFNAKIVELNSELESKQSTISRLKDELAQKEQLISEKENSAILLKNQLAMSESKFNDSKLVEMSTKKLKEKFDQDLKNMKEIHEHQTELNRVKTNMLEKTIENYQKGYNELSKSSDAIVNYDSSKTVYTGIIDDIQKHNAQLETEKIDLEVRIRQLSEQQQDLLREKENLNKKYLAADQERMKYITERDAYDKNHLEILNSKEYSIGLLNEQLVKLNESYSQLDGERNELLIVKLEYEQLLVTYNETTDAYQTLYQQANELVNQNQALNNELNHIKRLNEDQMQRLEELNFKLEHLEEDNSDLNRNNIGSKLKLEDLKEQLEARINEIKDINVYKRELTAFNELNSNIERLNIEIGDKNELIEQLNHAKDFLETTNSQLLMKNIKMQLYLENMNVNLEHVEKSRIVKEYEDLKIENFDLKERIDKLNNEIVTIKPKFDELKQKLNENLNLNENFNKLKKKFDEKVMELDEKNVHVNKLSNELSEIKFVYEENLNKLDHNVSSDNSENLDKFVRNELKLLQNDLNVYMANNQMKISSLNKKYEDEKNKCEMLNEEIRLLKEPVVGINESTLELEMMLNNKTSEICLLQEQSEYYYNMLSAYQAEMDNRAYQIESLNYELANLKVLNDQQLTNNWSAYEQEQQNHLAENIDYYKHEVETLRHGLDEKLSIIDCLNDQINECNKVIQSLKDGNNVCDAVEKVAVGEEAINIKLEPTDWSVNDENLLKPAEFDQIKLEYEQLKTSFEIQKQYLDEYGYLINECSKLVKFVLSCDDFEVSLSEILTKFEIVKELITRNKNELYELNKLLEEKSINLEELIEKNESLRNDYSNMAADLTNLTFKQSEFETVINDLKKQLEEKTSDCVNLELRYQDEIQKLNVELEKQLQQYDLLKKKALRLKEKVRLLETSRSNFSSNSSLSEIDGQNKVATKIAEVDEVVVQQQVEKLVEYERQIGDLKMEIEKLNEYKLIEEKLLVLQQELDDSVRKNQENVVLCDELRREVDGKAQILVVYERNIEDIRNEFGEYRRKQKDDIEALKQSSFEGKYKESLIEIENMKKKYDSLKAKAHMFKEKLKKYENQHEIVDVVQEPAQIKVETVAKLGSVEYNYDENVFNEENKRLIQQKVELKEHNEQLQTDMVEKQQLLDDLNRKYNEITEENASLKNQIIQANEIMNQQAQSIEKLEAEIIQKNDNLAKEINIGWNDWSDQAPVDDEQLKIDLNLKLSEITDELNILKEENESLKNQIIENNSTIDALNIRIDLLSEIDSLRNKIQDVEERNSEANKFEHLKQSNFEEKYNESLIEIENMKKKYDSLKSKAHLFKEKLKKYEIVDVVQEPTQIKVETVAKLGSGEHFDETNESLVQQITELKTQNQQNNDLIKQLDDDLKKEFQNKENMKIEYEILQQKALKFKAMVKKLRSPSSKSSSRALTPTIDYEEHDLVKRPAISIDSEVDRKIEELNLENLKLNNDIKLLKIEFDESLSLKNEEIDGLNRVLADLNENYQKKMMVNGDLKMENDRFKEMLDEFEEKLAKETDEKLHFKNEFDNLHEKSVKLKSKIKLAKDTKILNANSRHVVGEELLLLNNKEKSDDDVKLNEKINELENINHELNEQLDKMRKVLVNCETLEMIENVKVELSQKNADIEALNIEILSKNEEIIVLKNNEEGKLVLDDKNNKIKELIDEIDSLKNDNNERQMLLEDLTVELNIAKGENDNLKNQIIQANEIMNQQADKLLEESNAEIEKINNIKGLKDQIDELLRQIDVLKNDNLSKKGWNDWLDQAPVTDMNEKQQLLDDLKHRFNEINEENDILKNQIIHANEIMNQQAQSVEKLEAEIIEKNDNLTKEINIGWNDWSDQAPVDDEQLKVDLNLKLSQIIDELNIVKEENESLKKQIIEKNTTIDTLNIRIDLLSEIDSLRNMIQDVEERNSVACQNEIEKLKADLDDKNNKINELLNDETVDQKVLDFEQLKYDIDGLSSELQKVKNENESLKAQLDDSKSIKNCLETEIFEKNASIDSLNLRIDLLSEIDSLRNKIEKDFEEKNRFINNKNTELVEEIDTLKNYLKQDGYSTDQKTVELEKIKEENESLRNRLAQADVIMNQQVYQEQKMDAEIVGKNESINELLIEIQNLKSVNSNTVEIMQLRIELADKLEKMMESAEQIEFLSEEIIELKNCLDEKIQQINVLNDEISALKGNLETQVDVSNSQKAVDGGWDDWTVQETETTVDLNKKTSEFNSLKEENIELKSRFSELNQLLGCQDVISEEFDEINGFFSKLSHFLSENQHLKVKIKRLEIDLDEKFEIINNLNVKINYIESLNENQYEMSQKQTQIHLSNAPQNDTDMLTNQITELNTEISRLNNENAHLVNKIEEYKIKIENLISKNEEYEVENKNLKSELDAELTQNDDKTLFESVIDNNNQNETQDSIQVLQNENFHLRASLTSLQQQAHEMLYDRDVHITQLGGENESLREKLAEPKVENNNSEQNLKTSYDDLNKTFVDLQADHVKLTETNEILQQENIYYKTNFELIQSQANQLLNERDLQITNLSEECDVKKMTIETLNDEILQLKEKLNLFDNLLDENNGLKETISVYQLNEVKLNEEFTMKISFKDDEIKGLSQELNEKYKNIDCLIETSANSIDNTVPNNDVDYLNKRCVFLEEQLHKSRFICEKILKKLEKLKLHNEGFNNKLKSIKTMMVSN